MSKLLLDLARPFLRHSPRFTGYVYKKLGGARNGTHWSRYGTRTTRETEHGYKMILDLGHWSQRATYYEGRFYDLAAQRVIKRLLRPGDTFIDVGANIGMLTLCAAAVVGSRGTVLAFEPHPEVRAHFQQHLEINHIGYVHVTALSCSRSQSVMQMPTDSSGHSTLRVATLTPTESFDVELLLRP